MCSSTRPGPKDRSQLLSVMSALCSGLTDRQNLSTLVLGGSDDDIDSLRKLGFENITLSNLASELDPSTIGKMHNGIQTLAIDAENMAVPSNSFDLVFAHEVLHHCRSPHRALCEMLRGSRKYIIFMEPNDSLAMRLLVRMRLSFPYEIGAVIDNCGEGGVGDHPGIPNFVYRWNENEVSKTVSSYLPEYTPSVRAYPYWDFNVDEKDLMLRKQTRISSMTALIGPKNFLAMLKMMQKLLNRVWFLRTQGNKFLCMVEKRGDLKPWLTSDEDSIAFNWKWKSL